MIVNPRRRNQVHFPQSRLGTETSSQIDDSNLTGKATDANAEGEGPKAFRRTKIRKQKKHTPDLMHDLQRNRESKVVVGNLVKEVTRRRSEERRVGKECW